MSNCPSQVTWISIVGARPQFIKVSPVCRAVEAHNHIAAQPRIEHRIIHTGQHYDREMAELIFEQMGIPKPCCNLEVGSGSQQEQLARILERLEPVLDGERPDWVIVYGDTNSALAGALGAARLGIRLAHVEAGCRSYSFRMPEEQNRVLTDHLSDILLAPSERAVHNLQVEGIGTSDDRRCRKVALTGDVMYDALLANLRLAESLRQQTLDQLGVQADGYYVLTMHRAENTARPAQLQQVVRALQRLDLPVVFPVHPRTRQLMSDNSVALNGNIRCIAPLGYLQMLAVCEHARKIITDSGGVQKEALYLKVPCVTLRNETEWPETVDAGANRLVAVNENEILEAVGERRPDFESMGHPYGDGKSSARILNELLNYPASTTPSL